MTHWYYGIQNLREGSMMTGGGVVQSLYRREEGTACIAERRSRCRSLCEQVQLLQEGLSARVNRRFAYCRQAAITHLLCRQNACR